MGKMSIEFWVVFQMMIDIALVVLVIYVFRNLKSGIQQEASKKAAGELLELLEPVLQESQATAQAFESQLMEKQRLIHDINQRLDSRIISLNLLLNRSQAYLSCGSDPEDPSQEHVYDQQEAIIALYQKGHDPQFIADKLGMPKGEIDLVLDLKMKFAQMARNRAEPAAEAADADNRA